MSEQTLQFPIQVSRSAWVKNVPAMFAICTLLFSPVGFISPSSFSMPVGPYRYAPGYLIFMLLVGIFCCFVAMKFGKPASIAIDKDRIIVTPITILGMTFEKPQTFPTSDFDRLSVFFAEGHANRYTSNPRVAAITMHNNSGEDIRFDLPKRTRFIYRPSRTELSEFARQIGALLNIPVIENA